MDDQLFYKMPGPKWCDVLAQGAALGLVIIGFVLIAAAFI